MAPETALIHLFCEDNGHEQFVTALCRRLETPGGLTINIDTKNARGGSARAVSELKAWQKTLQKGLTAIPDILIVMIDGNCTGWHEKQKEIEKVIDPQTFPNVVIGCPDPHVERWCLADPESFHQVIGVTPPADPTEKCEKSYYKNLLREALDEADFFYLASEMEVAADLVAAMNLKKLRLASLKSFVDSLGAALKSLHH